MNLQKKPWQNRRRLEGVTRRRKNPPLARWVNAAEILPEELLMEVQKYIDGDILYIPKVSPKKEWGWPAGPSATMWSATVKSGNFTTREFPLSSWENNLD